jgi:hypothetical protein
MRFAFVLTFLFYQTSLAKTKVPLVSANYLQAIKCFPGLKDETLKTKFSLDALKNKIDEKFPSISQKLLTRNITFVTQHQEKRMLHLKPKVTPKGLEYEMFLESVDQKGTFMPIAIPEKQRKAGTQEDINQHLLQAEIQMDEKTFDDTKPNNHKLSFKLAQDQVQELVFRRQGSKSKLYCYVKAEVGALCLCK